LEKNGSFQPGEKPAERKNCWRKEKKKKGYVKMENG